MSQQGKNLKKYEAVSKVFNDAVAEIFRQKTCDLLVIKVYYFVETAKFCGIMHFDIKERQ